MGPTNCTFYVTCVSLGSQQVEESGLGLQVPSPSCSLVSWALFFPRPLSISLWVSLFLQHPRHADTREYYQLQRLINYQGWKGNSMVISLHSFVFRKKKTEACRSHHLVSPLKWKPWFLKDTKIGPRPLNQASDDLNQVSARMISSIAFFHVPLEGRHVEHVYVERDPPPTTVASPFSCTW